MSENEKKTASPKILAQEYGVSTATLMKWIRRVPNLQLDKPLRLFTPKQLELIRNHLG